MRCNFSIKSKCKVELQTNVPPLWLNAAMDASTSGYEMTSCPGAVLFSGGVLLVWGGFRPGVQSSAGQKSVCEILHGEID